MTTLDKYKQMLVEFHTAYKLPIARSFAEANHKDCPLRVNLIAEEYKEYEAAKERVDLIDALGDLLYVLIGTNITIGITPIDYQGGVLIKGTGAAPKLLFPDAVVAVIRALEDNQLCYRKLFQSTTSLYWKVESAAAGLGFDLMEAVARIHSSNMTKLWKEEEVRSISDTPDLFTVTPSGNEKLWIVKRKSDGKVVKSPSYTPVDLTDL